MPLRLYVQARRLEAARQMLLGTSMTVMQVAEKCGVSDFNYFARIFKKRYGMPPSALRKKAVEAVPGQIKRGAQIEAPAESVYMIGQTKDRPQTKEEGSAG